MSMKVELFPLFGRKEQLLKNSLAINAFSILALSALL